MNTIFSNITLFNELKIFSTFSLKDEETYLLDTLYLKPITGNIPFAYIFIKILTKFFFNLKLIPRLSKIKIFFYFSNIYITHGMIGRI